MSQYMQAPHNAHTQPAIIAAASIKTLDIAARLWRDKVNGNTYSAARLTVNYGLPGEIVVYFEWGYGGDSMPRQRATEWLHFACGGVESRNNGAVTMRQLWHYRNDLGVIIRETATIGLKREMVSFGVAPVTAAPAPKPKRKPRAAPVTVGAK